MRPWHTVVEAMGQLIPRTTKEPDREVAIEQTGLSRANRRSRP